MKKAATMSWYDDSHKYSGIVLSRVIQVRMSNSRGVIGEVPVKSRRIMVSRTGLKSEVEIIMCDLRSMNS